MAGSGAGLVKGVSRTHMQRLLQQDDEQEKNTQTRDDNQKQENIVS